MDLHPGEKIVFEGRPVWRSILSFYITGLIGAVVIGVIVALVASTGLGVVVFLVLRQKADEADEAEQADEVPDEVALIVGIGQPVFGWRANTAPLARLSDSGADGHGHQEQRE